MKILIVSSSDIQGGAARAAYRLHQALLAEGVDSQMLVKNKASDDYTVIPINKTKIQKALSSLRPALDATPLLFYKQKTQTLFSTSFLPFSGLIDAINQINPDVVHLHWINDGMIRIEDLGRIKAPIVWSLHDMWPFTGGCHYDDECQDYKLNCSSCKVLNTKSSILSMNVYQRKSKTYMKCKNLTVIGLSRWLTNCAKESSLFQSNNVVNLPNPINTNIYKPFNKNKCRELWNLPGNKQLVLFGAIGAVHDPRKGFKKLSEALLHLTLKNIEFVVFGASKPHNAPDLGCKVHYVGCLKDDISLVSLYNAVDVMVVPSLQEAFGQTASESMACGVPVVAFAQTGLLDIVDHLKNGYLATPFDTKDLAAGIEWILSNKNYNSLSISSREKIVQNFDSNFVAKKYIDLYRSSRRGN